MLSVLDEASEWSNTSARPNHHDWYRWVARQFEGRLANERRHQIVCRMQRTQPRGTHAIVHAAGRRCVLHNDGGDVHLLRMLLWRRRDGIVPRSHWRNELQEVLQRHPARWEIGQYF
jgi:hypothetical protein